MQPEISVIIPCFNEEDHIEALIRTMLDQDLPQEEYELLFVDGMSTDGTREIIQQYAKSEENVRLIDNEKRYVPFAMNKGIEEARGDILFTLGAHAYYPPAYLSFLSKKLKGSGAEVVGVAGKTETLERTPKGLAIQKALSHPLGVGNSHFRVGVDEPKNVDTVAFGCYWKETLQSLGGFNEALVRNQDIELNKRIHQRGGKLLLFPDLSWTYYARSNFKGLARNNFQNGLWNLLTVYKTKEFKSLSLRHFIPLAFVLSLILPPFLGLIDPLFLWISPSILLLYSASILGVSIRISDRNTSLLHMVMAFFVLHFSYGLGSLIGLIRIDQLFGNS